jgi:hypothetical protein
MSANNVTFQNSVTAAGVAALASKASNLTKQQGIITAGGSAVGFLPGFPAGYATYAAAVAASIAQKVVDDTSVETVKQGTISVAKDTLRTQGEIPL